MPVPLSRMMDQLPAERRDAVARHAEALVAEHRSLAEIRKALNLTQADVATALKSSQANVAQIERKRNAVMVSTLERVVRAMGGELELVVNLPHRGRTVLALGAGKDRTLVRPKTK